MNLLQFSALGALFIALLGFGAIQIIETHKSDRVITTIICLCCLAYAITVAILT